MATTKRKKQKGKKGRKLSPENKFQREWEKVEKLQQRNAKLRIKVAELVELVQNTIKEEEELLTSCLYQQTQQLIVFLSRKSMAEWQRQELLRWIQENMEELFNNPFNGHLDLEILQEEMRAVVKKLIPDEVKALLEALCGNMDKAPDGADPKNRDKSKATNPNQDMFEDLFVDFEDMGDEEAFTAEETGSFFDDLFAEFNQYEEAFQQQQQQKQHQQAQALSQVFKASSINKMFRRIAAVIHPDKETDADKKQEKHVLMRELVEARDDRNIVKIFSMYKEHLGRPAHELIDGDHENIIQLLQHQVALLKDEHESIIYENPLHGDIYHKFNGKTPQAVKARMAAHTKILRRDADNLREFVNQVTSVKKLRPHLEKRYESLHLFDPKNSS